MLTIARVALVRLFRDRSNLFFVVAFPLLLVLLIGISFGGEDGSIVVAVAADDDGLRDEVVAALADAGLQASAAVDAASARSAAADGEVDAAVVVPALGDGTAEVSVLASAELGPSLVPSVDAAIAGVTLRRQAARALAAVGLPDTPPVTAAADGVTSGTEVVDEGDDGELAELAGLGRFDLGASSQVLLFVFITALSTATTVVQMRRLGIVQRMLAGPTSVGEIIAGLGIGQVAVGLTQALVVVIVTGLVFDVSWGDPVASAAVLIAFSLVSAAASLLLGAVMDNEEQAGGVAVPIALVLAAFGGSMLPLELFPDALVPVSRATPHAWGNLAFAQIVRRDGGIVDVLPNIGVLLAFATVIGALAVVLLRRRIVRG